MIPLAGITGYFFMPVLAVIFCLNLVAIIKKTFIRHDTRWNTFWMTLSFVLITWSIVIMASGPGL